MADPVSPKLQKLNETMNAPMNSGEGAEGESLWSGSSVLQNIAKRGSGPVFEKPQEQSAGVRSEAKPQERSKVKEDPGLSRVTPDTVADPNAGLGKTERTKRWGGGYGNS